MVTEDLRLPSAGTSDDDVLFLPASFAQERLWFLDRFEPDTPLFNVPAAFHLRGRLDVAAFKAAVSELVARHETLRTTFTMEDGRLTQVVAPPDPHPLQEVEAAGLEAEHRARAVRRLARREARTPFDLAHGPLLRATLVRLGEDEHALLLTLHHIIADGWSMRVLYRELESLYQAFHEGRRPELPALPIQYADFAQWQRQQLSGATLEAKVAHWRQRLAGAPKLLELPADHPRPSLRSHDGAGLLRTLPTRLGEPLAELAAGERATAFIVLAAAFSALLSRHTGQHDMVFGTAAANRDRSELELLIGFFVSTVPLRVSTAGDPTFRRLVGRLREVAFDAFANQDLPFERLVEELVPERSTSHTPLLQVMFLLEEGEEESLYLPEIDVQPVAVDTGTAKYDLAVSLVLRGGRMALRAVYGRALFDRTTIERLLAGYGTLLAAALADPDRPLSRLPVLGAGERHQMVHGWNDTAADFPRHERLHHAFERRAAEAPGAPAVASAEGTLSYAELDRRANRLAHHLRTLGVGPNALVGVHLQRTPRMIEAVLAVHKAGGAYVPLETTWPAERIRWIVAENDVRTVIAEEATLDGLAEIEDGAVRLALLDETGGVAPGAAPGGAARPSPPPPDLPATPPEVAGCDAGDLAYVNFTSGSTGRPKGVMVRHRPAVNLVHWVNDRFAVGPGDRLLFVTALAFDLSVYDVFGTLAAGATIRLADAGELADPQRLVRLLRDEPITFWDSAPAALQQCVPYLPQVEGRGSLRLVFTSGDWMPLSLPGAVRDAFPGAEVVSLGGATEATIWSNFHRLGEVDPEWASIPYGRPIANARYHVLDAGLEPVPIGVAGDLWIGGGVLSAGYAANPRQTAIQFRPDPLAGEPGERLYATGDRARYWPCGTLEFLGRLDTQVKVRGYRIELGEIEAVLAEHPALAEAVVLAREDHPGQQRLVAYYRRRHGAAAPDGDELGELVAAKLPVYMHPGSWVEVESWPLSPTGKLDRRALPAPEAAAETAAAAAPAVAATAVPGAGAPADGAPRTRRQAEQAIAAVWAEILKRDRVTADGSFFDQGGNSLLLAQVHVRLQEVFARDIPMLLMFRHPTVDELAAALLPEEEAAEATAEATADAAAPADAPAVERRPGAGVVDEAIAVVGMAGRFPGARDLDAFWSLLDEGREGIRFFSDDELLAAGVDPARLDDDHYVKGRGALDDPELFDAAFFDLSPREAQVLDPQQRIFLETAWAALEDAGRPPRAGGGGATGPRVGVFAGVSDNDYDRLLADNAEVWRAVGRFQIVLGNQPDYVATRLSYKLDLTGPAMTVLTACSTSLVAVHLACRSLALGECELALAGGVSVQSREVSGYPFLDGGIDSPDGHTRAFDAAAAGSVAGSGCGVVALKRLDRALADGDPIRAVVRGSAVNNDGARKVGFTAPSVEGQASVIAAAQRAAGVDPSTVSYVEAHGTATPLGDPIEIAGLKQAWSAAADRVAPGAVAVGAVKSNVGHLDAAAGVAGLIKTVLALENERIPPTLHFRRPNPELGIEGSPFRIAAGAFDWRRGAAPRRAGVSSFGIGGTNAHLVLEEAPRRAGDGAETAQPRPLQLLLVSAKSAAAADRAAERLAAWARRRREGGEAAQLLLADAAFTLEAGRRRFAHRRAAVAGSLADAAAALGGDEGSAPEAGRRRIAGEAAAEPPPLVFLYPGQGAQYPGMGGDLYAEETVFRDAVDRCCELLRDGMGIDLRRVLYPPAGGEAGAAERLTATELAQPALFTVCWALAELLESWGLEAEAAIGHSIGEYVAAARAGVFDLEAALTLVAERGRLMGALPPGGMLAVRLPEAEVAELLTAHRGVELAAVNTADAAVASGPRAALAALARQLAAAGTEVRELHTSHAFHSAAMEPILDRFAERVAAARPRPPRRRFVSNLTGGWIADDEATDPGYWARHLRSTVRFADGLSTLLADGPRALVEVGPGRALTTFARRHQDASTVAVAVRTLPHPQEQSAELAVLLDAVGRLWTAGVETDAGRFWAGRRQRRISLPGYPFERRRFWYDGIEAAPGPEATVAEGAAAVRDAAPKEGTEATVAAVWRDLLGVADVGRRDDFFDLGGSSLAGVGLASRLALELAVELPGSFLLEAPTVAEQAALIDRRRDGEGEEATSCLVRLQRGTAGRRPLFMVHQVGGHVFSYRALGKELGADQPLCGLRSRGLEAGEQPLATIAGMADHYLGLVRAEQPRGPYLLGGASMGGMVAWEMARRLLDDGEQIALLALMDSPCGDQMPRREANAEAATFILRERTGVRLDGEPLRALPFDERWQRALDALVAERGALGDLDVDAARRQARVLDRNVEALYDHRPQPLPTTLLFFRAGQRRPGDPPRPELPWIELARGGCETVIVDGDHESMHEAANVAAMARLLAARIALVTDERCRRLLTRGQVV